MKHARIVPSLVALAVAALFAGCTTTRTDTANLADSTTSSSVASDTDTSVQSSSTSTMGSSTTGTMAHGATTSSHSSAMNHGSMDMKSMCDMNTRIKSARTEAEREAALDANVRAMSSEERTKYMEMMRQHCK